MDIQSLESRGGDDRDKAPGFEDRGGREPGLEVEGGLDITGWEGTAEVTRGTKTIGVGMILKGRLLRRLRLRLALRLKIEQWDGDNGGRVLC